MLDSGEDFVLLDCRMEAEYNLVHIEGSKLHVLQKVGQELPDLVDDYADSKVVCYCHKGARSFQMAAILRDAGIPEHHQKIAERRDRRLAVDHREAKPPAGVREVARRQADAVRQNHEDRNQAEDDRKSAACLDFARIVVGLRQRRQEREV